MRQLIQELKTKLYTTMIYKDKYLYLILALIILVPMILSYQEYSLLEITADNYKKKLFRSSVSLYESGINACIPDAISIVSANEFATSNNYSGNGYKIERAEDATSLRVHIENLHTGLQYTAIFDANGNLLRVYIQNYKHEYDPAIKETINKLLRGVTQNFVFDAKLMDITCDFVEILKIVRKSTY